MFEEALITERERKEEEDFYIGAHSQGYFEGCSDQHNATLEVMVKWLDGYCDNRDHIGFGCQRWCCWDCRDKLRKAAEG